MREIRIKEPQIQKTESEKFAANPKKYKCSSEMIII